MVSNNIQEILGKPLYKRVLARIAFTCIIVVGALSFLVSFVLARDFVSILTGILVPAAYASTLFILIKANGDKEYQALELILILTVALLAISTFIVKYDFLALNIVLLISPLPILLGLSSIYRVVNLHFLKQLSATFSMLGLSLIISELVSLSVGLLLVFLLVIIIFLLNTEFSESLTLILLALINFMLLLLFFRQNWVKASLGNISGIFGLFPEFLLIFLLIWSFYFALTNDQTRPFLLLIWSGLFLLEFSAPYFPPGSGSLMIIGWPLFLVINISILFIVGRPKKKEIAKLAG